MFRHVMLWMRDKPKPGDYYGYLARWLQAPWSRGARLRRPVSITFPAVGGGAAPALLIASGVHRRHAGMALLHRAALGIRTKCFAQAAADADDALSFYTQARSPVLTAASHERRRAAAAHPSRLLALLTPRADDDSPAPVPARAERARPAAGGLAARDPHVPSWDDAAVPLSGHQPAGVGVGAERAGARSGGGSAEARQGGRGGLLRQRGERTPPTRCKLRRHNVHMPGRADSRIAEHHAQHTITCREGRFFHLRRWNSTRRTRTTGSSSRMAPPGSRTGSSRTLCRVRRRQSLLAPSHSLTMVDLTSAFALAESSHVCSVVMFTASLVTRGHAPPRLPVCCTGIGGDDDTTSAALLADGTPSGAPAPAASRLRALVVLEGVPLSKLTSGPRDRLRRSVAEAFGAELKQARTIPRVRDCAVQG